MASRIRLKPLELLHLSTSRNGHTHHVLGRPRRPTSGLDCARDRRGAHAPEHGNLRQVKSCVEEKHLRPRKAKGQAGDLRGATSARLFNLMRAPGPGSTGGSRPLPVETPPVHFVWVDAAIACMLAFSAPLRSVEVSHCQRTRAAALAGLHPEKVHLGLQQQPQLPCAAANLPERERLHDAISWAAASLFCHSFARQ